MLHANLRKFSRDGILLAVVICCTATLGCAGMMERDLREADATREVRIPQDLAAHPDFRTEWWYFTGNLTDEAGDEFSFQLVFFMSVGDPRSLPHFVAGLISDPLHFSHFCLTDHQTGRFVYDERIGKDWRAKNGAAGARSEFLFVWNGDWSARDLDGKVRLSAKNRLGSLDLVLTPEKPWVRHGQGGFFRKAKDGRGGYYISGTRLRGEGILTLDGRPRKVAGLCWHDHEYGTRAMGKDHIGWDWFSIQLDDGFDLMVYLFRKRGGGYDAYGGGTLVDPAGNQVHVPTAEIDARPLRYWKSPDTWARYPVAWRLRLPGHGLDLRVQVRLDAQEVRTPQSTMTTYYEGATRVRGTHGDRPVTGVGFLELTGYVTPFTHMSQAPARPPAEPSAAPAAFGVR